MFFWPWHGLFFWPFFFGHSFMALILLILILWVIFHRRPYYGGYWWHHPLDPHPPSPSMNPAGRSAALDILEQRYARGEIQRDEYLQKKNDLMSGRPI